MSSKREIDREKHKIVKEFVQERALELTQKDRDRYNYKITDGLAREKLFIEELDRTLRHSFKELPKLESKPPANRGKIDRVLNVLLSDLHFGSDLDPNEFPHAYGTVEEARRLAAIFKQVADYKPQHRQHTRLIVHLGGDLICGNLDHDPRQGDYLARQCSRAMYLLSQGIRYISSHFSSVEVYCTPGNHGRNTKRHKERATDQKIDSFETVIHYGMKLALANIKNVKVNIPIPPYYTYEVFGNRGFVSHGDTMLKVGYPGNTINVANIEKFINKINSAQANSGLKPFKLFAIGHVHLGSIVHLPNGTVFMSNGCLIPPDGFALSNNNLETMCGQWIWESVDQHLVGDHRFVTVDVGDDKNPELDKIIKPFKTF